MDADALAGQVMPYVTAAIGAYGAAVLTRIEDAAAGETVWLGQRFIRAMLASKKTRPGFGQAVTELAASRMDSDFQAALRGQIRLALREDNELAAWVADVLPAASSASSASTTGERSQAVGRDNRGQMSTGDHSPNIQNIRKRKILFLPLGLFVRLARSAGSAAVAHPVAAAVTCVVVAGAVAGGVALQSGGSSVAVAASDSIGVVGSPLLGNTVYQGTPATKSGEAWYQFDKAGGTTANIHVRDTSAASANCADLDVVLDNSQGTGGVQTQDTLSPNSATDLPVTTAGLYYVEVSGDDCTPTSGTTFSIEPESSAAWTAPVPPGQGSAETGVSIGAVAAPLAGDELYRGTVATVSGEAWYQLDKVGGRTANVMVADTTVDGSTNCTGLNAQLDSSQGTGDVITQSPLESNGVASLPVTTAGLYYVEISSNNCTPTSATTFSIEPESSSAWSVPAQLAVGSIRAAGSMSAAATPLAGDLRYKGTAATGSGNAWYQLDKLGDKTANVVIEDTTVDGSTSCTGLEVQLDNAQGSAGVITQSTLASNSVTSLPVTTAGVYYVELSGSNCSPTSATTFAVEPQSSSAWGGSRS